jgi:BlaI family penicillinase repressor
LGVNYNQFIGDKLKGEIFMAEMKMGVVESHFADIIWANEPLHSRELVKLCEKELNWNRSTTYTVLRKLCERGIFQNNDGIVSSVLSKNDFYAVQSEQFVDETFEGSLPAFIAAFTQRKGISQQEAAEIRRMIDAAAGKE